jgi:hypothetical protein
MHTMSAFIGLRLRLCTQGIGNPSITSETMVGIHVLQALYGSLNEPDFQPLIPVSQKSPLVMNAGFSCNQSSCNTRLYTFNPFDAIADLSSD